jgi:hypothetical protein
VTVQQSVCVLDGGKLRSVIGHVSEDCTGHQNPGEGIPLSFVIGWTGQAGMRFNMSLKINHSRGKSLGVTQLLAMQRSEMEFRAALGPGRHC